MVETKHFDHRLYVLGEFRDDFVRFLCSHHPNIRCEINIMGSWNPNGPCFDWKLDRTFWRVQPPK